MSQKAFNYKKAVEEIESLIQQIEAGQPDVDQLSRMVKRAAELIAACRAKLSDTDKELEDILRSFDEQDGGSERKD